jgi:hypothetical protein
MGYWTREQHAALGDLESSLSPIERDLGPAIAAVWALYESTLRALRDACVMHWTQEQATMELTARLQAINLILCSHPGDPAATRGSRAGKFGRLCGAHYVLLRLPLRR